MKNNFNSCKLNFSCLVGSESGHLKVINGFDWTTEDELKFNIGPISVIEKYEDEYYLASLDKLYKLHSLLDDETIHYSPETESGEIIGFGFIQQKTVVGFDESVHVISDNKLNVCFGKGKKYNAFKLLRNDTIAIGGTNTEMSVYDILSHEKAIFTSKAEPNKGLSLPGKVNITSIEQDSESDSIVYCGTKFNTVQLYDIRSNQRKPQLTANFERSRSVVTLSAISSHKLIAGSNGGCLGIIDFKFVHKKSKPTDYSKEFVANYAKFKGFLAGTISDTQIVKSVCCDVDNDRKDILLSSSIDGHLAVFDVNSREMLKKIYLGKKPLSILVDEVYGNIDDDDLWGDLDAVEQDMERKRPTVEIDSEPKKKIKK